MQRRRGPVAVALVYQNGRVRWSLVAETEEEQTALYPVGAIVGRHATACANELRAWAKVRA